MKKQFLAMAAVFAAIILLFIQQVNAQTWNQTGNVVTPASKLGSTNLAPVIFVSNNIERMRLDSLGRFGVGTINPSATLHVNGSFRLVNGTAGAGRILTSDAFGLTSWATPSFWSLNGNTATNPLTNFIGTTDSVALIVRTRNLERIRVTALGLVGVGTATPSATLHVNGSFRLVNGTAGAGRILTSDAFGLTSWATPSFWSLLGNAGLNAAVNFAGTTDSVAFVIRTRNIERMRVSALGGVGIGTANPIAALSVGANKFNVSSTDGDVIFTDALGTIRFPASNGVNAPMIQMFESGTLNRDRMVIAHSAIYNNWGLQYQDTADKFNFLSGGTPVLTADLGALRVGVGTNSPGARFDIAGTGTYNLTGGYTDFRLGNSTYNIKMGVANSGGGAGDGYIAASNRLYLGTSNIFGRSQTVAINSDGTVGVGTFTPGAKLGVVGDTAVTVPTLKVTTSFVGTSDVRGISSYSKTSDGWGYGIESTGGFIGGYFNSLAGAYTGTGYGVFATASGTAGTRIGVYGTASGGTLNNWGGYFPTKTYTSELRVGGESGATGYVAAINGKLIATEVRVDLIANWPDYVFSKDHNLLSIEALEAKINTDKHLPGVPSAAEMEKSGIMLGEMQTKTMEKLEENTLYIIQLNNKIKELEKKIEALTQKAD